MAGRPTPFDLVFAPLADERFPALREGLVREDLSPHDRDAFLMVREVVALIRDLRPDEGVGEAMDQLTALVHHAYLLWSAGVLTLEVGPGRLTALLGAEAEPEAAGTVPHAFYVQFPEHRIWARLADDGPFEPLDGCFVARDADPASLRVLGAFGFRPEHAGLTVAEVSGPRPRGLARADGSPLFASTLPGGAARLYSLTGAEELLELGWRSRAAAAAAGAGPVDAAG